MAVLARMLVGRYDGYEVEVKWFKYVSRYLLGTWHIPRLLTYVFPQDIRYLDSLFRDTCTKRDV